MRRLSPVLLLLFIAVPSAFAAQVTTSPSGPAELASNSAGALAAVWMDDSGVMASIRPPGGPWSAPRLVSQAHAAAAGPRVGITEQGDVLVTWDVGDGGTRYDSFTVRASRWRLADGTWTAPSTDWSHSAEYSLASEITPTPAGDALVFVPHGFRFGLARRGGPIESATPPDDMNVEAAQYAPDGSLVLAGYTDDPAPPTAELEVLRVRPDGTSAVTRTDEPGSSLSDIQLAVGPSGSALVTFQIANNGLAYMLVGADGTVRAHGELPTSGAPDEQVLAQRELSSGEVQFVVSGLAQGPIEFLMRHADGSFAVPQPIGDSDEHLLQASAAIDEDGLALIAWLRGYGQVGHLAVRHPDGGVSTTAFPGRRYFFPGQVLATRAAHALAWTESDRGHARRTLHISVDGEPTMLDQPHRTNPRWIDAFPASPHLLTLTSKRVALAGTAVDGLRARCEALFGCRVRLDLYARSGDAYTRQHRLRRRIVRWRAGQSGSLRLPLTRRQSRRLRTARRVFLRQTASGAGLTDLFALPIAALRTSAARR